MKLKDIISTTLSRNSKEISLRDIMPIQMGGESLYDGWCDGPLNQSQCEPVSGSSQCQVGGHYDGWCDGDVNESQCTSIDIDDSCGGSIGSTMSLSQFRSATNAIIRKYRNEIGYDKIKINKSALVHLKTIIDNSVSFGG